MTNPVVPPDVDPVVVDASLGALGRVTQLRDQLGEAAHVEGHTMESLADTLVSLVMEHQFPASESRDLVSSYKGTLAEDGRYAGVLAAEAALGVLDKELMWYQQLLVLAASFASLAEKLPEPEVQRHLLARARRALDGLSSS